MGRTPPRGCVGVCPRSSDGTGGIRFGDGDAALGFPAFEVMGTRDGAEQGAMTDGIRNEMKKWPPFVADEEENTSPVKYSVSCARFRGFQTARGWYTYRYRCVYELM